MGQHWRETSFRCSRKGCWTLQAHVSSIPANFCQSLTGGSGASCSAEGTLPCAPDCTAHISSLNKSPVWPRQCGGVEPYYILQKRNLDASYLLVSRLCGGVYSDTVWVPQFFTIWESMTLWQAAMGHMRSATRSFSLGPETPANGKISWVFWVESQSNFSARGFLPSLQQPCFLASKSPHISGFQLV